LFSAYRRTLSSSVCRTDDIRSPFPRWERKDGEGLGPRTSPGIQGCDGQSSPEIALIPCFLWVRGGPPPCTGIPMRGCAHPGDPLLCGRRTGPSSGLDLRRWYDALLRQAPLGTVMHIEFGFDTDTLSISVKYNRSESLLLQALDIDDGKRKNRYEDEIRNLFTGRALSEFVWVPRSQISPSGGSGTWLCDRVRHLKWQRRATSFCRRNKHMMQNMSKQNRIEADWWIGIETSRKSEKSIGPSRSITRTRKRRLFPRVWGRRGFPDANASTATPCGMSGRGSDFAGTRPMPLHGEGSEVRAARPAVTAVCAASSHTARH
jgi:hypothetical protein